MTYFIPTVVSLFSITVALAEPCTIPEYLDRIDTALAQDAIEVEGNRLIVNDRYEGLMLFDVTDPGTMVLQGTIDIDQNPRNMLIYGDVVCLVGSGKLSFVDIGNPGAPSLISTFDGDTSAGFEFIDYVNDINVDVENGVAFMFGWDEITALDISDLQNPFVLSHLEVPGMDSSFGADVVGQTAYVMSPQTGMFIFDITNPYSMQLLSQTEGQYFYTVSVVDDLAYVGKHFSGISIFDVADPNIPVLLGEYDDPIFGAFEIAVRGQELFIAGWYDNLVVMNVAEPSAPFISANAGPNWEYNDLCLQENTVYASLGPNGVCSFDVSPCTINFACDSSLNFFDISTFLSAYTANDPVADITGDGSFDFFDVSAFLQAFSTGCP